MEAEVLLQFRYLDSDEQGSSKAFISSDRQTVWDLKLLIQEIISAPACDVKVFFQGRQLQIASLPLSNLYLRDGDVLEVEATAKIDIPSLRRVILELKNFEDRVNKGENSFEDCTSEDDLELTYSKVEWALNTITDQFFAPWNTATAAANRHFFVQEGGFAALMALLKYSQQHPCGLTSREGQIERFLVKRRERKIFQNHQQLQLRLQAECFSLLWRFMVKAEERKYVMDNGGMELILCGLMLQSEAHLGVDNRWNFTLSLKTVSVNQQALGCLAGCVEYDKHAQEIVASDSATVDKLLDMMHKNSEDYALYRLFFGLVVANTLFYLTFSPKALKKLTENKLYLKLIPLTEKFLNAGNIDPSAGDMDTDSDDDILHLGYYLCLILARMLASPLVTIDDSTTHTINTLIDCCLSKITPTAIAMLEEIQCYVWVTLVPLVHLAFAGGLGRSRSGIPSSTNSAVCHRPASTVLTTTDSETEVKLPLDHYLGKSSFFPNQEHPSYLLAKNLPPCGQACSTASNCERLPEDCFSMNNKFPGSSSVQQLGIFAIQHLLYSSANRQLLLLEGLLQYLICLSWQLQRGDKRILEQELNKFNGIEPPSLKAAAKSVLARLHGFETVFYTM